MLAHHNPHNIVHSSLGLHHGADLGHHYLMNLKSEKAPQSLDLQSLKKKNKTKKHKKKHSKKSKKSKKSHKKAKKNHTIKKHIVVEHPMWN